MKIIEIKTNAFFEMLKLKDQSMWEIFAQMIDGEEKMLHFLNDDSAELIFQFMLPKTLDDLELKRKEFTQHYSEKLQNLN